MQTKQNIERHGIYKMIDGQKMEMAGWDQESDANDGDMDHVIGWIPADDDEGGA